MDRNNQHRQQQQQHHPRNDVGGAGGAVVSGECNNNTNNNHDSGSVSAVSGSQPSDDSETSLLPALVVESSAHDDGDDDERAAFLVRSASFGKQNGHALRHHRLQSIDEGDENNASAPTSNKQERPALRVQFEAGDPRSKDPCASPTLSLDGSSSSSSSSSDDDSSSLGLAEARPPDGGWGWVVVFATFVVNLIADGIAFSFGLLNNEFLKYFGESTAKTALVSSLFMAMPLLSGPIASFLTDRYGCRRTCIFGSLLATVGFVASTFANNVETLLFTFGIVAGFGLSLCYVAAVVIVAYYFEKKRSLATGMSVCGSGIGTFLIAPFFNYLLEEYGWRGATLILAGLVLNIAVCGALMRDLPWIAVMAKSKAEDRRRHRERKRLRKLNNGGSSADSFSADNKSNNTVGTGTQPLTGTSSDAATSREGAEGAERKQFSSLVNLPTYVNNGERVPVEVLELLATHKNVYNVLMLNYPSMMISRSFSDSGRLHGIASPPTTVVQSPTTDARLRRHHHDHPRRGAQRAASAAAPATATPSAYFRDLRLHRHSLTYRGAMLNIKRYRLRASSCPDIYRNSMTTIAKEKSQWYAGLWEFWDLVVDMLDFSHFANPHFLLFALSNFLLYLWYDVPYVYLTHYSEEMGFEENSSFLLSAIGIVNMLGEILFGWAGDWEGINAGVIYAVCMLLCGLVTAIVPFLKTFQGLCTASGAFGFFIAANYSLTSIILVELISLENFTNAYGLLLLVQGVANLLGPPLAGWIFDEMGKHNLSFYLGGFFIAFSGLLLVVLPLTKKLRQCGVLRRKETASASISNIEDPSNVINSNGKDKSNHIFV